ncbi:MAG: thioredoxin [Saprospiraceae bacterium]
MANFKELINSDKPVLIDFYADWCGPCKTQAPILEQVKNKVGDSTTIVKIDVDRNQQLAGALNVRSIPTLMIFQNGEMKWKKTGVASAHELETTLAELNKAAV